jgi:hypothetical protein
VIADLIRQIIACAQASGCDIGSAGGTVADVLTDDEAAEYHSEVYGTRSQLRLSKALRANAGRLRIVRDHQNRMASWEALSQTYLHHGNNSPESLAHVMQVRIKEAFKP